MIIIFKNKKGVNYYIFIIFTVFVFIVGGYFDTILNAFKFFVVITTYVFFPGYVTNHISKITYKNKLQFLLLSAAIGYAQSIFVYAVALILGIQIYAKWIYFIYFLLCIIVFFRKKCVNNTNKFNIECKDSILLSSFLCAAFILGMVIYQFPNISASVVGYRNMTGDLTYWFKNCVAATKGYPLPELSIKGLHLYWHIFSCFEIAFLHFTTGIEIYTLCFTYAYIWQLFFLVGGIYVCASMLFNERKYTYLSLAVLLFTSGLDAQTYIYYQFHLYRCSLAFIEGYAMSLFAFSLIIQYMREQTKNISLFLISLMLFAVTLGLKAPCACVVLAAYAMRIITELQKNRKRAVIFALEFSSYLLLFYLISKVFIVDANALNSSTSSHRLNLSITETIFKSGNYEELYAGIKRFLHNKYFAFLVTFFIYLAHSNYVISFLIFSGIVLFLMNGNGWNIIKDRENCSLLAASLSGVFVFVIFSHPGFSQVYFMFEAFAFVVFLSLRLFEQCNHDKIIKKIMMVSILLIIMDIGYNVKNHDLIYRLKASDYASGGHASNSGNDVSGKEIEGLRWIRDNLPQNVVLVTNKVLSNGAYRTFITSGYSERQVYLEGYGSANLPSMELVEERLNNVRNYYSGEDGGIKKLVEEGCTHSVFFKGIPETQNASIEGDIIYENDDIIVFSLIK